MSILKKIKGALGFEKEENVLSFLDEKPKPAVKKVVKKAVAKKAPVKKAPAKKKPVKKAVKKK
jgi:hypothetical protein